jgi:hypothetical protein
VLEHLDRQFGAAQFAGTGVVFDFIGVDHLSARRQPVEHQHLHVGPDGIDSRGHAGRPGADDNDIIGVVHGLPPRPTNAAENCGENIDLLLWSCALDSQPGGGWMPSAYGGH